MDKSDIMLLGLILKTVKMVLDLNDSHGALQKNVLDLLPDSHADAKQRLRDDLARNESARDQLEKQIEDLVKLLPP